MLREWWWFCWWLVLVDCCWWCVVCWFWYCFWWIGVGGLIVVGDFCVGRNWLWRCGLAVRIWWWICLVMVWFGYLGWSWIGVGGSWCCLNWYCVLVFVVGLVFLVWSMGYLVWWLSLYYVCDGCCVGCGWCILV